MDQNRPDNFITQHEPDEVVLEYVAEPKPYVAYYVQPCPLPGKGVEPPAQTPAKPRRRWRKALKVLLLCLVSLLVLFTGLVVLWWLGLLPDGFYDDPYDNDYGYYYYYDASEESAAPELPVVSAADGVRLVYEDGHGDTLSVQDIYRKVNPSTVTVVTELQRGASIGTGVIMTSDGYVITNAHVVAGGTDCCIVLADGAIYDAALVGYDMEQDLAVIKAQDTKGLAAKGLPAAEFGDSDALSVGDPVYAIGNPLGVELRGTLTDGIISAINRDVEMEGVMMTLIQTNAALNNGNSGGPLINQYGQVIGINVMKMGRSVYSTASVEGLGFAIPISSSAYVINDILRCGEVQGEPMLGISVDRTPAYLPDGRQALRVYSIDLGHAGDKAGLEVDDLIYEADGMRTETSSDLLRMRHRHIAGEKMLLKVFRGGEYLEITVTLEAKK